MTPAEIRSARVQLGLTQAGLARVLGLADDRIVRRWEAGDVAITGPANLAIRYMLRYGPPERALKPVQRQSRVDGPKIPD